METETMQDNCSQMNIQDNRVNNLVFCHKYRDLYLIFNKNLYILLYKIRHLLFDEFNISIFIYLIEFYKSYFKKFDIKLINIEEPINIKESW